MIRVLMPILALTLLVAACGDGESSRQSTPAATSTVAFSDSTQTLSTVTDVPATQDGGSPSPTDDAGGPTAPAAALTVELSDFAITPSAASVPLGPVTVAVNNNGVNYHSLLFIKTDLPANALPTDEDGAVDELDDRLDVVDEVFELPGGESDAIETELPVGAYVLVCNVVDDTGVHYQLGMRKSLTVTQ